jgi:hypothetical protein
VVLATFNTIFIAFTILDYSLARGKARVYDAPSNLFAQKRTETGLVS